MRRGLLLAGLGWLAGTATAVGVGVRAVEVVTASVTGERPDPLSAAAVSARLRADGGAGTPAGGGPPPGPAPATGTPPATGAPVTTATTGPSGGDDRGDPGPEDRTYQLTGGSVGVRFENRTARLLWATPAPGFRVESSAGSGGVDVRFRADHHESRLRAYWQDGPQEDIEERPR